MLVCVVSGRELLNLAKINGHGTKKIRMRCLWDYNPMITGYICICIGSLAKRGVTMAKRLTSGATITQLNCQSFCKLSLCVIYLNAVLPAHLQFPILMNRVMYRV